MEYDKLVVTCFIIGLSSVNIAVDCSALYVIRKLPAKVRAKKQFLFHVVIAQLLMSIMWFVFKCLKIIMYEHHKAQYQFILRLHLIGEVNLYLCMIYFAWERFFRMYFIFTFDRHWSERKTHILCWLTLLPSIALGVVSTYLHHYHTISIHNYVLTILDSIFLLTVAIVYAFLFGQYTSHLK